MRSNSIFLFGFLCFCWTTSAQAWIIWGEAGGQWAKPGTPVVIPKGQENLQKLDSQSGQDDERNQQGDTDSDETSDDQDAE